MPLTSRGIQERKASYINNLLWLAGEPGFEPGLTESESVGLPLTYSPIGGRWRMRSSRLGGTIHARLLAIAKR